MAQSNGSGIQIPGHGHGSFSGFGERGGALGTCDGGPGLQVRGCVEGNDDIPAACGPFEFRDKTFAGVNLRADKGVGNARFGIDAQRV